MEVTAQGKTALHTFLLIRDLALLKIYISANVWELVSKTGIEEGSTVARW